ncbi:MAG: helix-turn-helix domain-containing protein [Coprobacillus sp.]|nr:helix-turn-helix domain-containing protein [Coprobacillus sp.]
MAEKDIGERIKSILKARNMTQKELSDRTGISTSLLSKYLSSNLFMRSDVLCNIAKALDVSVNTLIEDNPSQTNTYTECVDILSREGAPLSEEDKMKLIKIIMEHE